MSTFQSATIYQPMPDAFSQSIYNEENDQLVCTLFGYKNSRTRSIFYHLFCILFGLVPYVFFHSYPKAKCKVKCIQCSINTAELLLVKDTHRNYSWRKVHSEQLHSGVLKYFYHQHTKYVFLEGKNMFGTLSELFAKKNCDKLIDNTSGLNEVEYSELFKLYGPNKIEVEVKSYWKLFVEEVFNPFYMFQVFSIILWSVDDYIIYAGCVVFLTLFSSIASLLQTRKQSENLHDIVESSKCHEVTILRTVQGTERATTIDPEQLVPGDLIVLPSADYVMPCDAVLLTGQSIVNESVLTGESVPVTKTALLSSEDLYSVNSHKRHTLFSGTYVLQTRYYGGESVLARVVRTGFDTTKGNLVKSILYPTPVNLQFHKDALKFVVVLFCIAFLGMMYCWYIYIIRNATIGEIIVRALDIVTIVVPPALPAAIAVGTVYSQNRLKKLKIFCISPPRINVCGKIKLACFDKTGTLTHDGLTMNSVIPCHNAQFYEPVHNISQLDGKSKLVQGLATCHSLTRIGGKLNGDPLDLIMFEFTKWCLEEPGVDETSRFDMLAPTVVSPPKTSTDKLKPVEDLELYGTEESNQIGIIREFAFSSTVQCQSVIVKDLVTPNMYAFTKGAPEKLYNLCQPQTLPVNFELILRHYTTGGYRVIALAYKDLPIKFRWKDAQKAKRDMVERDLTFLGLLILRNPLKDETVPVIRTLHQANIRTVMITGDNIMTAIAVARDCTMVDECADIYILTVTEPTNSNESPCIAVEKAGSGAQPDMAVVEIYNSNCHIAMDGKTWSKLQNHFDSLIPSLLVRTTIFARFQPDQKTQLVTAFQDLDYVVSMVGDGANDCGALKAAHVGVSLSPAEASVAAPFTSGIPDISCLVWLILEGRCSLVTSFAIFKYMALYSLIQFITILILYTCHSILGNFQFLYIDLVITTVLAVTMGHQGPSKQLRPQRPMSSLVSPKNLLPLILQILLCLVFQLASLLFLKSQSWYTPIPSTTNEEVITSWENTVVFVISCFQYMILAWHFCKGKPYRVSVFRNMWFIISVVSLTSFTMWMTLNPCEKVANIMELMYSNNLEHLAFRYDLLLFPVCHFLMAGFIEAFIADTVWLKKFFQVVCCKRKPKNKYKQLLQELDFMEYLSSLPTVSQESVNR